MSQLVEIKAGPELDRAVAEAVGVKVEASAYNLHRMHRVDGPGSGLPFMPSEDLNAAFAAAEKVGLFERWSLRGGGGDSWGLYWGDLNIGVNEPTPALAICAAILKLSE